MVAGEIVRHKAEDFQPDDLAELEKKP